MVVYLKRRIVVHVIGNYKEVRRNVKQHAGRTTIRYMNGTLDVSCYGNVEDTDALWFISIPSTSIYR